MRIAPLAFAVIAAAALPLAAPAIADEKGIDRVVPKRNPAKTKHNPAKTKSATRTKYRGRCHKGVPASVAYYQKCALFGVPWHASAANIQRILGQRGRFHPTGKTILSYSRYQRNRYRGLDDVTFFLFRPPKTGLRMVSVEGMGLRITRAVRLGMKMRDVARRIPGSKIMRNTANQPYGVNYRAGNFSLDFNCQRGWKYQCRTVQLTIR